MSRLIARYCLTGSRTAIFPRGLRPRLRTLRLVQPYRLVFIYSEKKRVDNSNLVVSVVCHLMTAAVAPVLPVVIVVSVVVKK